MRSLLLLLCSAGVIAAQSQPYGLGQPATVADTAQKELTVFPNGKGLPPGRGTADQGAAIYKEKCAECHNEKGEGRPGQYPALVGGIGSLTSAKPLKTVGSFWPYATTVWDYIRRAMPFDHPRSLTADEVYAVTAFVLHLNGLVDRTQELNDKTLPLVKMPNRDGFVPDRRPDIKSKR
jgi:cytochrome c